jgi:hypothetical protein
MTSALIGLNVTGRSAMSYGELPAAPERHRPPLVAVGAGLVAAVGLLIVGRVAYGVLDNLGQDGWSSGGRTMFLILNGFVAVFGLFVLVLADQVRRGRMWGWIVSLVVLPFTLLYGGLLLLVTAVNGAAPLSGVAVVAASLAALLALTVPRTVRDHFVRRPVPVAHPYAGAAPGHPWGS